MSFFIPFPKLQLVVVSFPALKGLEGRAVRTVKANSSVAESKEESELAMTCGCISSHIMQEVVNVRLCSVDELTEADVLYCPVRLMYVPGEETSVFRSHIASPLHLHYLSLYEGACLLNPASGRWHSQATCPMHASMLLQTL